MSEFSLVPLEKLADIRMGQSPNSSFVQEGIECGIPFLQGNGEFGVKYPEPKYCCTQPPKIAESGSSLISVRAPVGETNIADQAYCIGRGLSAVKFHRYGEILGREILSYRAKALETVSQGTTFAAIGGPDLRSLLVADIPAQESTVLESILDTLDTQIQKTEALIAKLEKVKEGLLHDLLTRGIDENGQLRPSPEQAPELYKESPLGLIPREWRVLPLGEVSEIVSGVTLGGKSGSSAWPLVPYLRVANVQDGYLDLSEVKLLRVSPADIDKYRLLPGDVLMNEGGDFDKLGRGTLWEGQLELCLHQNHVFRVRPNSTLLSPHFLTAFSSSAIGKRYFIRSSKQSTNLASINSTQLKAFQVPIPATKEQDWIVAEMARAASRVEREKECVDKAILQKTGLMDDLLTGRVRVTPLLDEARATTPA
ncbi:restriction endonuclease subunit S [Alkalilimnicola ehrlichii]|uniref:restriction endonuclease subunit S n=1 Tax=Alkalilimnicola ehrlichii TaxID=351052 RepID=UPI003BA266B9